MRANLSLQITQDRWTKSIWTSIEFIIFVLIFDAEKMAPYLSSWLVSKRCQVGALFSFLLHRTLRGSHNLVKYWLWEIFYYFYCSSRFRWGNLSNISTFYFINRLFLIYWNLKKLTFKKILLGGNAYWNDHIFPAENAIVSVSVKINSYLCKKRYQIHHQ